MLTLSPDKLTIENALTIAKCAILDLIGEDSYEMARLHHEDGVTMMELAVRYDVSAPRICQRIHATHATLRRLSRSCGINLMPRTWESNEKRNDAKSCQTSS